MNEKPLNLTKFFKTTLALLSYCSLPQVQQTKNKNAAKTKFTPM